jgi:hypothetical protein
MGTLMTKRVFHTQEEYDSDGDGLAKSEYHDVFLVKMMQQKKIEPGNADLLTNGSDVSMYYFTVL